MAEVLRTFRPVRVAFHKYTAMWHDIRRAHRFRDKLGVVFRGPEWTPPGSRNPNRPAVEYSGQ